MSNSLATTCAHMRNRLFFAWLSWATVSAIHWNSTFCLVLFVCFVWKISPKRNLQYSVINIQLLDDWEWDGAKSNFWKIGPTNVRLVVFLDAIKIPLISLWILLERRSLVDASSLKLQWHNRRAMAQGLHWLGLVRKGVLCATVLDNHPQKSDFAVWKRVLPL